MIKALFPLLFALLTSSTVFAQDKELVFAGFGGSLQKAMQATIIPKFEKKYGVRVVYVTGTSNQIIAKVRGQQAHQTIDVIWANDTTHVQGKADKLFAKLDPKKVPNLDKIYDLARDPDNIGVVMGIQALALEYNTSIFKEKGWASPTSWLDLWDPKFAGHVVCYNMPIGYTSLVLQKVAMLESGSADNLEPGWKKFQQLVPNALAFVDPPAQVDALFSTGSAWIGFNGSARIEDLKSNGAPVELAKPKEGEIMYPQLFDVVANAPHPDLAQKFIDYSLSDEAQQDIAKTMLFGPVNKEVKLDAAAAARVPYGKDQVEGLIRLDTTKITQNLDALTARWTAMVGK